DDRQDEVVSAVEQFTRSCNPQVAARPGSDAKSGQLTHVRFGMEGAVDQRLRVESHDHPPDLFPEDRQSVSFDPIRGREPKAGDILRLQCHRLILVAAGCRRGYAADLWQPDTTLPEMRTRHVCRS